MTHLEQSIALENLLNAYLDLSKQLNRTNEETVLSLLGIFTKGQLIEFGFANLFENIHGKLPDGVETAQQPPSCEALHGPCWACRNAYCEWWKSDYVQQKAKEAIAAVLEREYAWTKQDDGTYLYEMFADYRDNLGAKYIGEILQSDVLENAFYEQIDESWQDCRLDTENELEGKIFSELADMLDMSVSEISEVLELEEVIRDQLYEKVTIQPDYQHYLKQEVLVDIFLDTGDGNIDYTANPSIAPCHYSYGKTDINDTASLLWLVKQQGYTKHQLSHSLQADKKDDNPFFQSVYEELENCNSHMAATVFLVKMTLEQLIKLNRAIKLQERNGKRYDNREYPDCGMITLGKDTTVGLYDLWCGGGSTLEIQLEKDVDIPVRFIRSALPDGEDGYSIEDVFGVVTSIWKESVKEIDVPETLEDAEVYETVRKLYESEDRHPATLKACRRWVKEYHEKSGLSYQDIFEKGPEWVSKQIFG